MTTKNEVFDLDSLNLSTACEKGFELELLNPITKEPLGVFIDIIGNESEVLKKHVRETTNARLRQNAMLAKSGKEADVETVEKIDARAIDYLVAATTGWRNVVYKGKALEFSKENAKMLYSAPGMQWIKSQVDVAVGKLENFIQG